MTTKFTEHATERSTYVITVAFKDETDAAVTPSAATWTLTDRAGAVINSRSTVAITPLATSGSIVLTGADLALPDVRYRYRMVTVEYTYNSSLGSNLPGKEEIGFYIDPLQVVA